ncbi:amidohydrolase [Flavobacterium crassostreae]|uniref:Amidohydrolase n=1 Tax=Flavobacterium crassostreae TaxID=1763534 RepID=A0A1B9DKG8_9FLAO|nr:amidohydrolase [Flavobacterium crassostreae]OCB70194.1 amidohydrolase [Flavobacterium crassostreae]
MENSNPSIEALSLLRKELHQYPEVSGNEKNTAQRIISFLKNYPPDEIITEVGEHGILALYKAKAAGKKLLFRSELDALPIEETNTFAHRSTIEGVSHKCGHDGHMAILCGLAMKLYHKRPDTGTVMLLFQPAEEDGSGAARVFNDPKFDYKPDFAFALHNLPGYPKHQIVIKNNTFTCAVNSMVIQLKGKTAHAGEPEKGINPTLAIAAIISKFNSAIQPDISQSDYCLITPIYTRIGSKAYGVSAGDGEVHFTVRSNSNVQMKNVERFLENTVKELASQFQLVSSIEWIECFQANENNLQAAQHIRQAAKTNGLELLEKEFPFTWGEDFGLFTQQFPGAMFGLGSGLKTPALHNPDYDFPDEIITTGVATFYTITKQLLHAH